MDALIRLHKLPTSEDYRDLMCSIVANVIQCYLKMGLYEDALHTANELLAKYPDHFKGLYRKGKAIGFLHKYDESISIFKHLKLQREVTIA